MRRFDWTQVSEWHRDIRWWKHDGSAFKSSPVSHGGLRTVERYVRGREGKSRALHLPELHSPGCWALLIIHRGQVQLPDLEWDTPRDFVLSPSIVFAFHLLSSFLHTFSLISVSVSLPLYPPESIIDLCFCKASFKDMPETRWLQIIKNSPARRAAAEIEHGGGYHTDNSYNGKFCQHANYTLYRKKFPLDRKVLSKAWRCLFVHFVTHKVLKFWGEWKRTQCLFSFLWQWKILSEANTL